MRHGEIGVSFKDRGIVTSRGLAQISKRRNPYRALLPVLRIRSFWVTRIRENTGSGSGSFIHKKTPCNLIFLVKYHCLKYSFVQLIFIFDFKCHKMIRFAIKNIYFAKHLKHIWVGSGSGRPFLGHPDPNPDPRIRFFKYGSGSGWPKKGRIRSIFFRIRNTAFDYLWSSINILLLLV